MLAEFKNPISLMKESFKTFLNILNSDSARLASTGMRIHASLRNRSKFRQLHTQGYAWQ